MKRLVSPPMNIPPSHIPLLDAVALVERVNLPRPMEGKTFGRRIRYIWEVVDYGRYVTISEWDPLSDSFKVDFSNSVVLEKIAFRWGKSREDVIEELEKRAELLKRMVERDVIELSDVAREVYAYYANPKELMKKYGLEAEEAEEVSEIQAEEASAEEAPEPEEPDKEEEEVEEKILNLLKLNNGSYPLWRIFVGISASKVTVLKALKSLREEGKIEISHAIVKLLEEAE